MAKIQSLSGGNPREILRIAHHAFRATAGSLDELTDAVLVKSAKRSGTVDDRERLAVLMADRVLGAQVGAQLLKNVAVADGLVLSRVLKLGGQAQLAVLVIKATDNLSEIDSARRVTEARKYLSQELPGTDLIVVSVGYSSKEVSQVLHSTATVLEFDEGRFASQLQAAILQSLSKKQNQADNLGPSPTDLRNVNNQLDKLTVDRRKQDEELQTRIVERVGEASAPKVMARELRTRRQMLDELSDLDARLATSDKDFLLAADDREIMRSLLISNESYVKSDLFERLGDIYLDNATPLRAETMNDETIKAVTRFRRDFIDRLRVVLRRSSILDRLLDRPVRSSILLSLAIMAAVMWWSVNVEGIFRFYPAEPFLLQFLRIVPSTIPASIVGFGITYTLRSIRINRWRLAAKRLRLKLSL